MKQPLIKPPVVGNCALIRVRIDDFSRPGQRVTLLLLLILGRLCCTKFDVDNTWYRVIVIESFFDKYNIYYIDYGNTESVMMSQ